MKQVLVIFLMFIVARCSFGLTCHNYTCVGSSCTTDAPCDSGSNPCQTNKMSMVGQEFITYSCAESNICTSGLTNTSAGLIDMSCCDLNLCNDGTNAPLEENLAYCYSASCFGEGCLPGMINYIDTNDVGAYCAASEDGCQTSMAYITDQSGESTLLESTGCASAKCVPRVQFSDATPVKSYCCKDRLCNNGGEMSTDANKEYCYAYGCVSSSCLSVPEAAEQGKTGFCEKPNEGCYFTSMVSSDSSIIGSGCIGESPDQTTCTPTSVNVEGTQTTSICCNTDRCNNGEETIDPNKKYCYVYTCISATCLTIAEAIEQGQTSLCEQSDKGCMSSSVITSNSSTVLVGCMGVVPGINECTPTSAEIGDLRTTMSCCSSNLCNSGDGTAEEDYCHVYTCTSTSAPCTSLSEAIKQGQTTKCKKSDKGCFAMKSTKTVSAGCVGEAYGMSECRPVPTSGEREVVCCKEVGCNDLTSASNPVFSYSMASLVLVASSLFQVLGIF